MKPGIKRLEDINAHLGFRPGGHEVFLTHFTHKYAVKGKPKIHDLHFSLALICPRVWRLFCSSFRCLCHLEGMFVGLLKQKGMLPAMGSAECNAKCRQTTLAMHFTGSAAMKVISR